MNLQKRRRANLTFDSIIVLTIAKEAIIQVILNEQYRKPSIIEDDSDGLDIE